MRGRVLVLLGLSLLFLPLSLSAQCNYTPVFSGPFRSTVLDLALDDSYLWAATSYGVSLFDRSVDPPALLSTVAIPGPTASVRAASGVAYAGSGTSIFVVRREGRTAKLVRSVGVGGSVNDLLLASRYLYVAGSNGITQLDLLDPLNPTLANAPAKFAMSGVSAYSLTISGNSILAADGDSTVEVYSVGGAPVHTRTITSLARSLSVRTNGTLIFVSDNVRTEVFGTDGNFTRLSDQPLPFATASVAGNGGSAVFLSGLDRHIAAYDFAATSEPVELFTGDIAPVGGSVNGVFELISTPTRLYVAGGDTGVGVYDISKFVAPYPLHRQNIGGSTSVISLGTTVLSAKAAGGLTESAQNATGSLTVKRQWDATHVSTIHDALPGLVLTSSNTTMTLWTLFATTPVPIGTVTLRATVRSAVMVSNGTSYAVLTDNTLWRVVMDQTPATAMQVSVGGAPSFIARSGSQLALADFNDDGSTTIRFYAGGNFAVPPVSATLEGSATGGISLSNGVVAASTFRGLQLVTMSATPSTRILTQTIGVAKRLVLSGSTLLVMAGNVLQLWDAAAGTLARQIALPATGRSFDWLPGGLELADVVTDDGLVSVGFRLTTEQPAAIASPSGNAYYRDEQLAGGRLYLFDGRNLDSFELAPGGAPAGFASVRVPGIIDAAATPSGVVTLSSTGLVSLYSPFGTFVASAQIVEGSDAIVRSIASIGGAAYVSLEKGCSSGSCERKTLVFDPRNKLIAQTASLSGNLVDSAVLPARAYALFTIVPANPGDAPAEIRVLNISDPFHPSVLVSRAAEGATKMPVSIAYANGTVYALGEKLYAYSEAMLTKLGEPLGAFVADATGATSYIDQRVRVDGVCAFVSGRGFAAQQYTIVSPAVWSAVTTPTVPAAVRGLELLDGRVYVLTDSSLEIWSTGAVPKLKHRAAR
jgi:hypothetical protein